jgi:hypothetical protein
LISSLIAFLLSFGLSRPDGAELCTRLQAAADYYTQRQLGTVALMREIYLQTLGQLLEEEVAASRWQNATAPLRIYRNLKQLLWLLERHLFGCALDTTASAAAWLDFDLAQATTTLAAQLLHMLHVQATEGSARVTISTNGVPGAKPTTPPAQAMQLAAQLRRLRAHIALHSCVEVDRVSSIKRHREQSMALERLHSTLSAHCEEAGLDNELAAHLRSLTAQYGAERSAAHRRYAGDRSAAQIVGEACHVLDPAHCLPALASFTAEQWRLLCVGFLHQAVQQSQRSTGTSWQKLLPLLQAWAGGAELCTDTCVPQARLVYVQAIASRQQQDLGEAARRRDNLLAEIERTMVSVITLRQQVIERFRAGWSAHRQTEHRRRLARERVRLRLARSSRRAWCQLRVELEQPTNLLDFVDYRGEESLELLELESSGIASLASTLFDEPKLLVCSSACSVRV